MISQTKESSYHDLFDKLQKDDLDIFERDLISRIKDDYEKYHKHDIKEIESLLFDTIEITNCKHCHSNKIVSFGHSSNLTKRYKCKDCNKTFSISTNSLLYSSKVNIEAWFAFLECILSGTSIKAACLTAKIAPKTGSEWMNKIFLAIKNYQGSIVFDTDIYIDETYVHVDKSKIYKIDDVGKIKKVKKLPRGISRNMICILVFTDKNKSVAKILNIGRPQRLKVYEVLEKHVNPKTHLIGDEDNSLVYSIDRLGLTRTTYHSNTEEAYKALQPIDQLCSRLKFFIDKHRGFKKDILQDYLNLFIFMDNEKENEKNLYLVTKKLLKLIFSYQKESKSL